MNRNRASSVVSVIAFFLVVVFANVREARAATYVSGSTLIELTVTGGAGTAHLIRAINVALDSSCNSSAYAYIAIADKALTATALTVTQENNVQSVRLVYDTGQTASYTPGSGATTCKIVGIPLE